MISDTKYNSTSYIKYIIKYIFIINKFLLYKTKKYLDLNFNTLIQTWIKNFNLEKKLINNNKNNLYKSIALKLYCKMPYKITLDIWINIMKEVKKKNYLY